MIELKPPWVDDEDASGFAVEHFTRQGAPEILLLVVLTALAPLLLGMGIGWLIWG